MMSNLNKSSAYRSVILFIVSFSLVVKVIFSSKTPKKRSKKMFPCNVQLSGKMDDRRFPSFSKQLTMLDLSIKCKPN